MTSSISPIQINHVAPNARSGYRDAVLNGQTWFERYGISDSGLRMAHFMAQVLHESGALTIQFESLNYSAQRLLVVWPKRFLPGGPLDPIAYAHDPEKLANAVYGGRMGNNGIGDGFKYRGRGLLQLTGKDSYKEATEAIQAQDSGAPDFVSKPDEVIGSSWALAVAAAEWASKGCNSLADVDNVRRVTVAINGGTTGLAERTEWLKRTKAVWC